MLERMSLRARLVLGVFALAALGLAVADVATYASLRSFLVERVDRNVTASAQTLVRSLGRRGAGEIALEQLAATTPGVNVGLRSPDGSVRWDVLRPRLGATVSPPPFVPVESATGRPALFEAGAEQGSSRYRVRAEPLPQGYELLVAASLAEVQSTLRRLLWIELLVTAAVLGGIAVLGSWVVRIGLRPLDDMGATAATIAAGDLSQRVDPATERTEVGRLGLALNAMLGQIESAFRAREASERRLRRFVADASHELRTPLTAVRAYAELFELGADRRPDDLARAMTGIEREAARMSLLVDDLLLLARLDEGRALEREPLELEQVVAEAVETARTVEPDRPIELSAVPALVLGDRNRLRQVVDNLLANARAHTPPGTRVRVTLAAEGGRARLAVADEGPGMEPEHAERVFERFYRADASRSRGSGGVGLGLSIVSAVAEAHGGAASVSSTPGAGSTFQVVLPLLAVTNEPGVGSEDLAGEALAEEECGHHDEQAGERELEPPAAQALAEP
jgi:two-component system OmpR family sensor kinase